jgi:riboflavin kinase/FMN adenylyltransferase
MKIVEVTPSLVELNNIEKGSVLTIGNFDGVHLGHQQILNAAKKTATEKRTQLIVMTFEPHPLSVLHPRQKLELLTSLTLKKHLLAEAGTDCLLLVKSTPELLNLSPDEFVERFISKGIRPAIVVEGESFNFGSDRRGNIQTLQKIGRENGFLVSVIEPKEVQFSTGQKVKISSTVIRNMLKTGDVADAALALSRPYRLIGQIIPGRGKGKQLGFPTANMAPPDQLVPAEGVYAGLVQIGDSREDVCLSTPHRSSHTDRTGRQSARQIPRYGFHSAYTKPEKIRYRETACRTNRKRLQNRKRNFEKGLIKREYFDNN